MRYPFPTGGRWTCPKCSRFIAESAIGSWDERDDSAYHGIRTHYRITCGRCGVLRDQPPNWTPTRWAGESA